MMSLRHVWSWVSPQIASHILISHIQSVFEHIDMLSIGIQQQPYTVNPHRTCLRCWGSGSLVESKWCHYVMFKTDSHLKLLPTFILDIYKVFMHFDMPSIGIQQQLYTVIPTQLVSDFGVLGHLWSQNDVITSCLRLTVTSNCFPHSYLIYTKCWSTLICCPLAYSSSLTQVSQPTLAQILGFWVTCGVKNDVTMSSLRLTATSNCFPHS